jgi:predicted lactoylglutathione lyase
MPMMMFLNLPVTDLERSRAFYLGLGFAVNPQFTDSSAACLVLDDGHLYLMLLGHDSFAHFTSKPIVDTAAGAAAIFSISVDDRDTVDRVADMALSTGGSFASDSQDRGFIYTRSFQDPDGHLWEITHLDLPVGGPR